MRKTSAYARKKALQQQPSARLKGLDAVVGRCTSYKDNATYNPDAILLSVRLALQGLLNRTVAPDDRSAFDALACAIGEAKIRYMEIGGPNNAAIDVLNLADDALLRVHERWEASHLWGLDGPAITQLKDGVHLFEEVLLASSPNQMEAAERTFLRWISLLQKGKLK